MKLQFERKIVTEGDYHPPLEEYLSRGWEIEKETTQILEDSFLFWKKQRVVKVWCIIREITPVTAIIKIPITAPKWKVLKGEVNWIDLEMEVADAKIKEAFKLEGKTKVK